MLKTTDFAALESRCWQAHCGGPGMVDIRITGGELVLVTRSEADITVRVISAASRDFLSSLRNEAGRAAAVEQQTGYHPDFDIATQFQGLIARNIITGFST